ncbi:hypothetical protein AL036_12600 [Salipiger aestuarii]|uniref:Cold shock CspA family protein n=1 Tax=Salipiger aestuarii TaxID=568098 RepID=A0A327Y385_9RHOB|nr:hypothetical protein [Salipiger aestuarii]EIE50247.1 hypothetical protein C357_14906 [Citreicella sp. 357]KAA8606909.1 hypothetical protein AL036_12600 [Salipiger aestuarii]KAA8610807.1 hypothetical protein AL037_12065 [Salipiger aestuarii]KAB2541591.1 hypothetical protein AL035_11630 [Salipiger aestuarii]RAK14215.1 hypothetical protein ATI53_102816 [Salipiger aestuarii]
MEGYVSQIFENDAALFVWSQDRSAKYLAFVQDERELSSFVVNDRVRFDIEAGRAVNLHRVGADETRHCDRRTAAY